MQASTQPRGVLGDCKVRSEALEITKETSQIWLCLSKWGVLGTVHPRNLQCFARTSNLTFFFLMAKNMSTCLESLRLLMMPFWFYVFRL